jgi:hypothetical protein
VARAALEKAKARNVQFLLPTDNIIGTPVNTGKLNKKGKPVIDIQNPQTNARPGYSGRGGRIGHRPGNGPAFLRSHPAGQDDHVERPDGDV